MSADPAKSFLSFPLSCCHVLVETGLCASFAEARRSLAQGGVRWQGEVVTSPDTLLTEGGLLQVGKKSKQL